MSHRPYDEAEELKRYVWRHYPEVVQPHQCIAHPDAVESALPAEYRAVFRRFYDAVGSDDRSFTLTADQEAIIQKTMNDVETANLNARIQGHDIAVNRCAKCARVLPSPKARQCLWCGADWH